MKRLRLFNVLLSALLALSMILPATGIYAATSTVKITNYTTPKTITVGSSFTMKGKISSNKKIKRVEIGVVDSNNKWTAQKYDNSSVNAYSFDIAKAASSVKFNKLKVGKYKYRMYAHTSDGKVHIVLNEGFTIAKKKATASTKTTSNKTTTTATTVKIANYTTPKAITEGSSFKLKGKITSNKNIKRVEIGIVNSSNKWTGQKYDKASLNTKAFDIAKADPYIKFGKLKAGKYKYRIYAHTSDGKVHIVLNNAFTIKKKASSTTSSTTAKTGKSMNRTVDDVKLIKYNSPNALNVGKKYNVRGTISSSKKINRVEIGIVMAATNKWTEYKYDKRFVNSKTFDISKAASTLKFNELPGGTYKYRIYIHTKSGCKLILNKKFTVKPSGKPQAAVNWAKKIANNNSFTYGAKPAANAVGCYFCGTNCGPVKYTKPKGYERTYVCLTFVGAAYAHGAKDPEILSECRRGRMTMYETDDNFRVFSCWMKIGKCKDLSIEDLQVGDVIIMWSDYNDNNGHVCMYIGNNNIVESSGGGWGANSIAIKYGVASSRLKSLSYNSRNYVMRYRH